MQHQIDKIHVKLPEIHAKGFGILEKFCHTNESFCQSPDSPQVTVTIKYPPPGILYFFFSGVAEVLGAVSEVG